MAQPSTGYFAQFLFKIKSSESQELKKQRFDLEIQDTIQEDEKLSEIVNLLETNIFDNSVSRLVNNVLSEVNL